MIKKEKNEENLCYEYMIFHQYQSFHKVGMG